MKYKLSPNTPKPLLFILLILTLVLGCDTDKSEEIIDTVSELSTQKVHVAFAGGGWRAHTGHAGWTISLLDGKRDLNEAFANVGTISSNSGGSWFNTMMAISPKFVADIEAKDAINSWGINGKGWLGQQQALFDNTGCKNGDLFLPCAIEYTIGLDDARNWHKVVKSIVYDGYSLDGKTLSNSRNKWAEDKNLLLAASMLTSNVLLNNHGLNSLGYHTHLQYYQACHSPAQPHMGEDLREAAVCLGESESYDVTPVTFSGLYNGSSDQVPPFLSALKTGESFNLAYSEVVELYPDSTHAVPVMNPLNNSLVLAETAAAASSAAAGFTAYVKKGDHIDIWDAAYASRKEALSFSLANDTVKFKDADGIPVQQLADKKMVRIADGGPVDNSGVAQLVSFLQQKNPTDTFHIIAFDNVTDSFPAHGSSIHTKAKVGVDIANLFGEGLCPDNQFCVGACGDYLKTCIHVPGLKIFDKDAFLNTPETWSTKSDGMELIYTKYTVTTVDNPTYGITKDFTGIIHAFTCVAPNAGTVPLSRGFKSYHDMLQFIHSGLNDSDGEGLKLLENAFGL